MNIKGPPITIKSQLQEIVVKIYINLGLLRRNRQSFEKEDFTEKYSVKWWSWKTDERLMSDWWATDEWLMSDWWATDEQLMSNWWATDERLMSDWWVTDELLMSNWWATDEQLMSDWWVTGEWLMSDWWATIERLMSDWWATDEQLMSNWWATDERLMSDLLMTIYWWLGAYGSVRTYVRTTVVVKSLSRLKIYPSNPKLDFLQCSMLCRNQQNLKNIIDIDIWLTW